jgi:hypothetical protein
VNREQRREWRRYVLSCSDLTVGQRLVLLALETFADFPEGTNAYPGNDLLAERCGFGTTEVENALRQGRKLALIEKTARQNPKRGLAAVYRLLPVSFSTPTIKQLEADLNAHEREDSGKFYPHDESLSTLTYVGHTNKEPPNSNPLRLLR